MTKYDVSWTFEAADDLRGIIEYIGSDSGQNAKKILSKIKTEADKLKTFPNRCRVIPELQSFGILQYRELIVDRWHIFFRVEGGKVFVLAVVDSRRNIEDILFDKLVRGK